MITFGFSLAQTYPSTFHTRAAGLRAMLAERNLQKQKLRMGFAGQAKLLREGSSTFRCQPGCIQFQCGLRPCQWDRTNGVCVDRWGFSHNGIHTSWHFHHFPELAHFTHDVEFEWMNLTSLELRANKLKIIHSDVFSPIAKIVGIPSDAEFPLHKLETLSLQGNEISRIEANSFNGLNRLKTLELHYNQLTAIIRKAFAGLPSIDRRWCFGFACTETFVPGRQQPAQLVGCRLRATVNAHVHKNE